MSIDKNMIKDIQSTYKESQLFFSQSNITKEMKFNFLKEKSESFYRKYSNDRRVLSNLFAIEILQKKHLVIIVIKNGSSQFPLNFVRLMDRSKNPNKMLKNPPNINELNNLMYSDNILTLEKFLEQFFLIFRNLVFPLRHRELSILRLLANPGFLQYKRVVKSKTNIGQNEIDFKPRIVPPPNMEILKTLGWEEYKLESVKRASLVLMHYKIVFFHSIQIN